jgi:hypothetical protein
MILPGEREDNRPDDAHRSSGMHVAANGKITALANAQEHMVRCKAMGANLSGIKINNPFPSYCGISRPTRVTPTIRDIRPRLALTVSGAGVLLSDTPCYE